MVFSFRVVKFVAVFLALAFLGNARSLDAKCYPCHQSADFVIVGGGTSGAALARLLSQDYSVILLEGGQNQDHDPLITDPIQSGSLVLKYTNKFFWGLGHTPVEAIPNQKRWAAVVGELLGGGSSVNGMQFVRGTVEFFNEWQAASGGDPSWGPANAYKVYAQMEAFNGVPGEYNPLVHGTAGPLDIRQGTKNLTAAQLFQNAVVSLGYAPAIDDYNDPANTLGAFQYWQLTQQPNKTRESSSTAYLGILDPLSANVFASRHNKLRLFTEARVVRVKFDRGQAQPVAKGVIAIVDGKEAFFRAKKEVILCSGFQSPILLELSGIGDQAQLSPLGITTIVNNPNVGSHAKNHPGVLLTGTGNVPASGNPDPEALYDGGAFLTNPYYLPNDRAFEVIGIATPGNPGAFTMASLILNPVSSGFIGLNNSDPLRMPNFNFNTYTDSIDTDAAFTIYNIMYNILVQMGLTPQGPAPVASPPYPTSGALYNYLFTGFAGSFQNYHYQSGCRMSNSALTGVVNQDGEVFNVRRLRVADVSIVPTNARGNTQAVAYLVANVIAQKILDKYK